MKNCTNNGIYFYEPKGLTMFCWLDNLTSRLVDGWEVSQKSLGQRDTRHRLRMAVYQRTLRDPHPQMYPSGGCSFVDRPPLLLCIVLNRKILLTLLTDALQSQSIVAVCFSWYLVLPPEADERQHGIPVCT